MKNLTKLAALFALTITTPLPAQEAEKPKMLSPGQIVEQAAPEEWQAISASDLLVMDLGPDAKGKDRKIIIQLMPPPFSQGWVRNIRKLAAAKYWDSTSINRVQDNYVVQWGDAAETEESQKPLPEGLEVMTESDYLATGSDISEANVENWDHENTSLNDNSSLIEIVEAAAKKIERWEKDDERISEIEMRGTTTPNAPKGWHQRDSYSEWVEVYKGWPLANKGIDKKAVFWPIHCYGAVGVGRGLTPNTGDGSQLYTVIGHAPRHLDRNIAVVGRIIEGMHHLSSLPRGFGPLGFYETPEERVPIKSIRLASELSEAEQPRFEYLDTDGESFAKYAHRRANREPPFFIKPAGGADICNIPVPVRRVKGK